jgi:hypothetical protein
LNKYSKRTRGLTAKAPHLVPGHNPRVTLSQSWLGSSDTSRAQMLQSLHRATSHKRKTHMDHHHTQRNSPRRLRDSLSSPSYPQISSCFLLPEHLERPPSVHSVVPKLETSTTPMSRSLHQVHVACLCSRLHGSVGATNAKVLDADIRCASDPQICVEYPHRLTMCTIELMH